MKPHLCYFGQTPGFGTGSPIIIFRHLARLVSEGWEIDAFVERGQDTNACEKAGIRTHTLPHRRKWWPPYNSNSAISRAIRNRLLSREAKKTLGGRLPKACLSYLSIHSHDMAELASIFSSKYNRPLLTIVHDDTTAFDFRQLDRDAIIKAHTKILNRSTANLFVSPELADRFALPNSKKQTLLPIPEGYQPALPQNRPSGPIRFFYAGRIWPNQLPLLESISKTLREADAELHLLATLSDELETFCKRNAIPLHPPFSTNIEALDFLASQADALLVAYSLKLEDMKWIKTSFPSKLVEYSHIGLPISVVADHQSSVARWLADKAPQILTAPDKLDTLKNLASELKNPTERENHQSHIRQLAKTHFSANEIHKQFKDFITAAVATT